MKKKYVFITILIALFASVSLYILKRLSPTDFLKNKSQIVGIYKSAKYGYSFQVPESFLITKEECKGDWASAECLEMLTITPKSYSKEDTQYLDLGSIIVINNFKTVHTGGQASGSEYNTTTEKWVDVYPTENGPLHKDMPMIKMGNNIVSRSTSGGGSHYMGERNIITHKGRDTAFILSIPLAKRIRCDGIKDVNETKACEKYLQHIHAGEDGSTGDSFFSEIFKDKDKILESFNWDSSNEQVSSTPAPTVLTSDWKTYTNETYGLSFKYPPKWIVKEDANGLIYINDKEINVPITKLEQVFFTLEIHLSKYGTKTLQKRLANIYSSNIHTINDRKYEITDLRSHTIGGNSLLVAETISDNDLIYYTFGLSNKKYEQYFDTILSTFQFFKEQFIDLMSIEHDASGIATTTDLGNGKTKIVIRLESMAGKLPAAIYTGSCNQTGTMKYALTNISNGLKTNSSPGTSETILNVSLDMLRSQLPLAIGVQSITSSKSLSWCGNIQ